MNKIIGIISLFIATEIVIFWSVWVTTDLFNPKELINAHIIFLGAILVIGLIGFGIHNLIR